MATAIKNPLTKDTLRKWMLENGGNILYDPIHPGVFTGYITITEERASAMLAANVKNRKMGVSKQIPQLRKEIASGNWNDNVSKINFTKDTVLSDGQNRLFSVVAEHKPIRCLVTWGVDDDAQLVTDRRGTRTLADDLQIAGVKSAKEVSTVGRLYFLRAKGLSTYSVLNSGGASTTQFPDQEIYRYIMSNLDKITALQRRAGSIYASLRELAVQSRNVQLLSIEFDEISEEDATAFWNSLSKGINLNDRNPIYLLRSRLLKAKTSNGEKLDARYQAALIIKAWNFYMKGETPGVLKYTQGGANPEPFPEIYNPYEMD